jgi:prepilin signal peptidase PulO-like enzyme (type II secretory pathway)
MNEWIYFIIFFTFSINSVIDDAISFHVRPRELAIGIATVIAVKHLANNTNWIDTIIGGATGALAFFTAKHLTKGRLGTGDIWFSSLIGCSFGFWTWDIGLLFAAFVGILWVGILRISRPRSNIRDIRIPFAPFMFIGSIVTAIYRGYAS